MVQKKKDEVEEWLYPKLNLLVGIIVLATIGIILWVAFGIKPK